MAVELDGCGSQPSALWRSQERLRKVSPVWRRVVCVLWGHQASCRFLHCSFAGWVSHGAPAELHPVWSMGFDAPWTRKEGQWVSHEGDIRLLPSLRS